MLRLLTSEMSCVRSPVPIKIFQKESALQMCQIVQRLSINASVLDKWLCAHTCGSVCLIKWTHIQRSNTAAQELGTSTLLPYNFLTKTLLILLLLNPEFHWLCQIATTLRTRTETESRETFLSVARGWQVATWYKSQIRHNKCKIIRDREYLRIM